MADSIAAQLAEADRKAAAHARDCGVCELPDPSRPTYYRRDHSGRVTEACFVGRKLGLAWLTLWRRRIDALSGVA